MGGSYYSLIGSYENVVRINDVVGNFRNFVNPLGRRIGNRARIAHVDVVGLTMASVSGVQDSRLGGCQHGSLARSDSSCRMARAISKPSAAACSGDVLCKIPRLPEIEFSGSLMS